jgi:hypothetical protein
VRAGSRPGRTKTPTSGDFTGAPMRAGRRPDAVIPAISALVLVLLTADGPILVRAALRTRHGGAIEAFDFSGAMAQRAGIGWYGHVCSFSSVDAGRLRAALRLELYQIISGMVMWSSGDARVVPPSVSPPCHRFGREDRGSPVAGRHSSWRVPASWLPWLIAWALEAAGHVGPGLVTPGIRRDRAGLAGT